jgi:hypothetical protein
VVLVVIDREWVVADDPAAAEVEEALRHGRTIIPVLLPGAEMPAAEQLPAALRGLGSWQAVRVRRVDGRWVASDLLDDLRHRLAEMRAVPPEPDPVLRRRMKVGFALAAGLGLLVGLAAGCAAYAVVSVVDVLLPLDAGPLTAKGIKASSNRVDQLFDVHDGWRELGMFDFTWELVQFYLVGGLIVGSVVCVCGLGVGLYSLREIRAYRRRALNPLPVLPPRPPRPTSA